MLTRPLVTIGISFLITAMVVSFFASFGAILLGIVLVALALVGFIALDGKRRIAVAMILLSGAVAAFSYAAFAKSEYKLDEFDAKTGNITAKVLDIKKGKSSIGYTVRVIASDIANLPTGFNATFYTKSDEAIGINDIVVTEAKVRKINSTPTFDMERFYRADGISASLSSYNTVEILQKGKHNLFYYAKQINIACCEIIDKTLSAPYSGLIKAILLGDKSDIDELNYNRIVRSGVSHIFVVSGLHVSLLSMLVFFLLKLLRAPLKLRSIVTLLAAWGFVLITGLGLPAIRAAIMMTVMMSANLFERQPDSLSSLFLAGIIIVLLNPAAVISGSFLLSFTATLGVVTLARPIENYINRKLNIHTEVSTMKLLRYLTSLVAITLASNIAMLPVIIYIFKGISLAAPLTNVIAVPLLPVLLVGALLLLCFGGIPFISGIFSFLLELILDVVLSTCEFVANLDLAYFGLNYNFVYIWLWTVIILVGAAWLFIGKKRVALNTVYISLGTLILCFCLNSVYNYDNVEITTLNSFETQSVVISQGGKASVISFGDDNYIDISVENFLRSKNINSIENYIFASKDKKNIADTELLTTVTDTYNIFLLKEDELAGYAADSFNPINGTYLLQDGGGYDIIENISTVASVDRAVDNLLISLTVGQTRIAITNSPDIAEQANCEILYYCGEYDKKLKQNKAKYVIILKEFAAARLNDEFEGFKAYESQAVLSIRQNGSYRFG